MAKRKRKYDRGMPSSLPPAPPQATASLTVRPATEVPTPDPPTGPPPILGSLGPAPPPPPFTILNARAYFDRLKNEAAENERMYQGIWTDLYTLTGGSIQGDMLRYEAQPGEKPDQYGGALRYMAQLYEVERAIKRRMYDAVIACSKAECRKFAGEFLKLPREVRNLVYAYAWEDDENPTLKAPWRWTCTHPKCECRCFVWGDVCPWALYAWVGDVVAREATESYYRSMTFCIDSKNHNTNEISQFLRWDHFHRSVKPLNHIRTLNIELFDIHQLRSHPNQRRLSFGLDLLREVGNLPAFHLNIRIHKKTTTNKRRLPSVVRGLRCVKRTLEDRGSSVTLWGKSRHGYWREWHDLYEVDEEYEN